MECKFYVGQTVAREWPVDTFDYDLAAAGVLTPPLNEPVTISRIFENRYGEIAVDILEYPSPKGVDDIAYPPEMFCPLTDTRSRTKAQVEKLKQSALSPRSPVEV